MKAPSSLTSSGSEGAPARSRTASRNVRSVAAKSVGEDVIPEGVEPPSRRS